jgi:hypothetical protein
VPLLEGQPKSAFIAQWRSFRERKRTAPLMVSLAEELSEREVDDLAEHYAALLPPRGAECPAAMLAVHWLIACDVRTATVRRCRGPTSARHGSPAKKRGPPSGR